MKAKMRWKPWRRCTIQTAPTTAPTALCCCGSSGPAPDDAATLSPSPGAEFNLKVTSPRQAAEAARRGLKDGKHSLGAAAGAIWQLAEDDDTPLVLLRGSSTPLIKAFRAASGA